MFPASLWFRHRWNHHINWLAQDCKIAQISKSGTQNWSLLRIWCSSSYTFNGYICLDSSLAGLYLVSHQLFVYILYEIYYDLARLQLIQQRFNIKSAVCLHLFQVCHWPCRTIGTFWSYRMAGAFSQCYRSALFIKQNLSWWTINKSKQ